MALRESPIGDPPGRALCRADHCAREPDIALLAGAARARGELPASTDPTLLSVTYLSIFFALIAWVQQTIADPEARWSRSSCATSSTLRRTHPMGPSLFKDDAAPERLWRLVRACPRKPSPTPTTSQTPTTSFGAQRTC
ncbi:MAG: hypothetical protein IPL19_34160 [Sandaracinaceae bacterium]|nr:hypothetical protein [Sandaracinaceae bacterium]